MDVSYWGGDTRKLVGEAGTQSRVGWWPNLTECVAPSV